MAFTSNAKLVCVLVQQHNLMGSNEVLNVLHDITTAPYTIHVSLAQCVHAVNNNNCFNYS